MKFDAATGRHIPGPFTVQARHALLQELLATAQLEAGAHVLDVNVGLPELYEAALLPQVTEAVQGIAGAPLQLDTADPKALENALRVYVGKPIINSVSGKQHVTVHNCQVELVVGM